MVATCSLVVRVSGLMSTAGGDDVTVLQVVFDVTVLQVVFDVTVVQVVFDVTDAPCSAVSLCLADLYSLSASSKLVSDVALVV